jgi:hypothetical protein
MDLICFVQGTKPHNHTYMCIKQTKIARFYHDIRCIIIHVEVSPGSPWTHIRPEQAMHHEMFNSATHPNENVLVLAVVRPVWDKTLKKESRTMLRSSWKIFITWNERKRLNKLRRTKMPSSSLKEFLPKGMNKIQADSRTLPTLPLLAFV